MLKDLIDEKRHFVVNLNAICLSGNFPGIVESVYLQSGTPSAPGSIWPNSFKSKSIDTSFNLSFVRKLHETFILHDTPNSIISKTSIAVNDLRWGKHFTS